MPRAVKKFCDLARREQCRRLKKACAASLKGKDLIVHQEVRDMKKSDPLRQTMKKKMSSTATTSAISNEQCTIQSASEDETELASYVCNENIEAEKTSATMVSTVEILKKDIPAWALKYYIPHNALTALLHLVRAAGITGLPLGACTILGTPRVTEISTTQSGEYFHYGLEEALQNQLRRLNNPVTTSILTIKIHVDGLPISKSSQSALWPVLGQIANNDLPNQRPFLIGVYHGYCKPTVPEEILEQFCTEYLRLNEHGFFYNNTRYFVSVKAVLCDAPARAFITCVTGHNATFGCSKCEVEGEYINNRMAFLNEDAVLRTDDTFKNRRNKEYHKRQTQTPLERVGIGMMSQVPLDYMHLVCLGVHKKLISVYLDGHQTVKFSSAMRNELSQNLISLAEWIPTEFARGVRGLEDFSRWKATEHRTFLLYVGPIVLQQFLPEANMQHYNYLHTAIRILCDPNDYKVNNKYAQDLLLAFVKAFKVLYGVQSISYNVHNLIHVASDAQEFGPLDAFSCFPFENFLKHVKYLIRKGDRPLVQICRRFNEMARLIDSENEDNNINSYPILLPFNKQQTSNPLYNQIQFEDFTLSSKRKADSTCYLDDGTVCAITSIHKKKEKQMIMGRILEQPESIQNYPSDSLNFKICCGTKWSEVQELDVSRIQSKAVRLVLKEKHYIFPLLHHT